MSTKTGPFEDIEDLKAHLEEECDAGRIFQAFGPAGERIIWTTDAYTAFNVYTARTGTASRGVSKLSWWWLNENMSPSELTELAREGIAKPRRI